ncbi:pteridine-dependent deoxygenase [Xanthomonas sp. GW]|uniref:chorismate transformation enzyme, FkbO/Hyg5 family n=1 Tax=unclassified Xanthomonas TaxID=2643310 RepID=UPI00163B1222|nr:MULTISPECIES: pteridine-dependent deoxygenase [unclassified Xanthomonas]QNH18916.1 pteridine-dependent deoxygenase [Xanthomonas sp. SS]QNH23267.1 pteridine-dependent deoxygenase [Xanthomonas sp. GW]
MSRPHPQFPSHAQRHPQLQVDYVAETDPGALLRDERVLAVFGFGNDAPHHDDPRYLRVPLQPHGPRMLEVWRTDAPVSSGRDGDIAWASDGRLQFGVIEIDEQTLEIEEASRLAYAQITAFVGRSATPRLLRIWNYLDAITLGSGDRERYRQFCVGRARGLGDFDASQLPAATAVGRCDDARVMQIYWLAAAQAGTPLENPRQVSAYRYPRQYGPQSPSFARAMLPPAGSDMPLLLSGTASVVGHASMHTGQLLAQLEETFANFDALLGAARIHAPDLPAQFGDGTRLKVYVREAADLPLVAAALDARFGERVPRLLLHAVICRNELAVEIDGVHG